MEEDPGIEDEEESCLIRSIEDSLEPPDIRSGNPVVDRHRAIHIPHTHIRRESEVDKECLSDDEPDEEADHNRSGGAQEENPEIFRHLGPGKEAPMPDDEECQEELEIIPSSVDIRPESDVLKKTDEHQIGDIRSDHHIQQIEFRHGPLFEQSINRHAGKDKQKTFLVDRNTLDSDLMLEEYTQQYMEWQEYEKPFEDSV